MPRQATRTNLPCTENKLTFDMPKSTGSHRSREDIGDEGDDSPTSAYVLSPSPTSARRLHSGKNSELDLRSRLPSRLQLNEHSSLLEHPEGDPPNYGGVPNTSRPHLSRQQSGIASIYQSRHHSRSASWGGRLASAMSSTFSRSDGRLIESKGSLFTDERVWYDQFTSTDWVHDSIADNFRVRDLKLRKD